MSWTVEAWQLSSPFNAREDLERGVSYVTGVAQGYYLLHWGWILQRLVDTRRGLKLIEQALEIGQGQDRQLELQALNNMAEVYRATGQPSERWSCMSRPCRLCERWETVRGSGHPQQHGSWCIERRGNPAGVGVV